MSDNTTSGFNIGAVSRLTGIARERIRIWERRYDAVVPRRDAANNRLYSQDDVDRLVLIRRLIDAGHAIGQIARLPLAELESRQAAAATPTLAGAPPGQTLAIGPEADDLTGQMRAWGLPAVSAVADLATAARWLAGQPADLIVAAFPTLTGQELNGVIQLHRSAPRSVLVLVYRFAPHRLLDQLARLGIRTVKAPLAAGDLNMPAFSATTLHASLAPEHDYRTRQFSATDLQRFSALQSAVACECPQHLANLVRDLQAFEDYTLACEATTAADAALHREVYDVIARARALAEDALGIIAAEERLTLPGD